MQTSKLPLKCSARVSYFVEKFSYYLNCPTFYALPCVTVCQGVIFFAKPSCSLTCELSNVKESFFNHIHFCLPVYLYRNAIFVILAAFLYIKVSQKLEGTRLSKIISEMFVVFVFWFGRRGKKRAVLNTVSYIRLVPMREILTESAPDCNVGTKWIFHLSWD